MALEKTLLEVPVQLLISNGGKYGQINIPSTVGFKLKQRVQLFSNTIVHQDFEVKRVIDDTNLILGPKSSSLQEVADLTSFLTAMNASIFAPEQDRQAITPDKFWRSVFEESPTVAIRTFSVDHLGRRYTEANPLPVQLSNGSIDIGTVNAQLEMFLTHKDNDPHIGDVHSSLRVGDGNNELSINPDGSLNVVLQNSGGEILRYEYNEANSVVNGATTDVVTLTAALGLDTYVNKIDYSGENIATFSVELNGNVIDKQRTYFGASLNGVFNYSNGTKGMKLKPGDILTLKVIHARPSAGDFNGRIQVVES